MKITIIGAGMAGLVAANMLRRHDLTILERAPSLPENHHAVLRFRSKVISEVTGIPFRKVIVRKAFWSDAESRLKSTVSLSEANLYAHIVTSGGRIMDRSIHNLEPEERYIAPRDFVQQAAKNLNISFGQQVDRPVYDHPVISTMPLPVMIGLAGLARENLPTFCHNAIYTATCNLSGSDFDIYQTIYRANPGSWYRATITGCRLIVESMSPLDKDSIDEILWMFFGKAAKDLSYCDLKFNTQPYGKIAPIDEDLRQRLILELTDKRNIYSLGRFATWRPLLLDNIVKDVHHIERMILQGCNYSRRIKTY